MLFEDVRRHGWKILLGAIILPPLVFELFFKTGGLRATALWLCLYAGLGAADILLEGADDLLQQLPIEPRRVMALRFCSGLAIVSLGIVPSLLFAQLIRVHWKTSWSYRLMEVFGTVPSVPNADIGFLLFAFFTAYTTCFLASRRATTPVPSIICAAFLAMAASVWIHNPLRFAIVTFTAVFLFAMWDGLLQAVNMTRMFFRTRTIPVIAIHLREENLFYKELTEMTSPILLAAGVLFPLAFFPPWGSYGLFLVAGLLGAGRVAPERAKGTLHGLYALPLSPDDVLRTKFWAGQTAILVLSIAFWIEQAFAVVIYPLPHSNDMHPMVMADPSGHVFLTSVPSSGLLLHPAFLSNADPIWACAVTLGALVAFGLCFMVSAVARNAMLGIGVVFALIAICLTMSPKITILAGIIFGGVFVFADPLWEMKIWWPRFDIPRPSRIKVPGALLVVGILVAIPSLKSGWDWWSFLSSKSRIVKPSLYLPEAHGQDMFLDHDGLWILSDTMVELRSADNPDSVLMRRQMNLSELRNKLSPPPEEIISSRQKYAKLVAEAENRSARVLADSLARAARVHAARVRPTKLSHEPLAIVIQPPESRVEPLVLIPDYYSIAFTTIESDIIEPTWSLDSSAELERIHADWSVIEYKGYLIQPLLRNYALLGPPDPAVIVRERWKKYLSSNWDAPLVMLWPQSMPKNSSFHTILFDPRRLRLYALGSAGLAVFEFSQ